jgi:hypothetical protein
MNVVVPRITSRGTSVVTLHLTELRHPKIRDSWHEVRSHVSYLKDRLRSVLPYDTQVSLSPRTVASLARTSLPLVYLVVLLLEHMCVVV